MTDALSESLNAKNASVDQGGSHPFNSISSTICLVVLRAVGVFAAFVKTLRLVN